MFQKHIFPNHLRLITAPLRESTTVTILVTVLAGSRFENESNNGIAHFLEHLFFKGTKKRPNTLALSSELDRVGGEYNAFTSKEITGFYVKVSKNELDLSLDVLSDMLFDSKFEETEIEKERGVIIEEINMYQDLPMSYVSMLWENLLFPNHPLGWLTLGKKEIIKKLKQEDFLKFLKEQYQAERMVVTVAGGVSEKEMKEKVEKYFLKDVIARSDPDWSGERRSNSLLKPTSLGLLRRPAMAGLPRNDKEGGLPAISNRDIFEFNHDNLPQSLFHSKKTDQTHLCLGVRAYDLFHPDRYVLKTLAVILGGNMSSRLFIEIRERRGWAYYIRSGTEFYTDTGYLVTQAGIPNDKVKEVIKAILEEYKEIKDKGIDEPELKKALNFLKGKMLLDLETSDDLASYLSGQEILMQKILLPKEQFALLDRVTPADIQRVAFDIFQNSKLNLAMIGPEEKVESNLVQL